jgi:hypothetical protein
MQVACGGEVYGLHGQRGRPRAARRLEDMSVHIAGRSREDPVFLAPHGGPVTDEHFRN